jgi:hypothetical protein
MNEFISELQNINSEDQAFLLFRHILLGSSFDYQNKFYVKHNSLIESTYITENNKIIEIESRKRGLLTEKDKLKILERNESWTKEQESIYQEGLKKLTDLQISKKKLVIPAQIKQAQLILEEEMNNFSSSFSEREEVIGLTLETYISERNYQYYLEHFFFKDEALTRKLFSEEEFDEMSQDEIKKYYNYYFDFQEVFNSRNLKKITCSPFILNTFFLSKTPTDFFGKPISQLTLNQISLYSNYLYYKNITESADFKSVPQEYYNDLNKLVDYYDQQYSIICAKNQSKKR